MLNIKAIIPARAGSLRVYNKNLRSFAGSSLLEIKIKHLLQVKALSDVCVSSEDARTLAIAEAAGATPIQRDPYFSTSQAPMNQVYKHLAENIDCDHVLLADCTNPLTWSESYEEAIKIYLEMGPAHDSLNSAALVKEFMWLDGKPINYLPTKKPRSQDLPDIVRLSWAINIISRQDMIRLSDIVGSRPKLMITGEIESLDVDTEDDFEIAETLYVKRLSNS